MGWTRARRAAADFANEARRNDQALRRRHYVRDVKHASELWADNRPGQARQLLESYRAAVREEDPRGFAWHYFQRLCTAGKEPLTGHRGEVYCAVFSGDGTVIATASQDRTVRLWDLASRTTCLTLVGHEDEINWVSFSPDCQTIATASDDHQIKLWDAPTGRIKSTLSGHQEQAVAAIFTPNGERVISCDRNGKVILWNVVSARVRLVFRQEWHAAVPGDLPRRRDAGHRGQVHRHLEPGQRPGAASARQAIWPGEQRRLFP